MEKNPSIIRVLHVLGAGEFGGAEAQILALLQGLQGYPVQVLVVTYYDGEFAERVRDLGVEVRTLTSRTPLSDYTGLLKAARAFAPHLIHTHGVRASLAGRAAGKELGMPVVTTVHSDLYYDYAVPWKREVMMELERATMDGSIKIICVSKALASTLLRRGYRDDQLKVITNAMDVEAAMKKIANAKDQPIGLRAMLGIPADSLIVMSVARMQRVKRLDLLIDAVSEVRTVDGRRVHAVLVGDGPERAALENKARTLEERQEVEGQAQEGTAGPRVHFVGAQSDVFSYLLEADLFVMTSQMEGLPIAPMEAMLCGIPVIAPPVGGLLELIEAGERPTGMLVDPTDAGVLSKAIVQLLQDKKARVAYSVHARERVQTQFSISRMAKDTHSLYIEMIRN